MEPGQEPGRLTIFHINGCRIWHLTLGQRFQEPSGTRPGTRPPSDISYKWLWDFAPYVGSSFQEPSGTKPGTKQNVRLVNILLKSHFPEPGGTKLGSKQPNEIPCMILYIFMCGPALIIILFKRAGRPPQEHLLNSIIRGWRVFDTRRGDEAHFSS